MSIDTEIGGNANDSHVFCAAKAMASTSEIVRAWLKTANGSVSPDELVSIVADVSTILLKSAVAANAALDGIPQDREALVAEYARFRAEELGFYNPDYALPPLEPVIPVSESVGHDYVTCLADGVKKKMLKRHVKTRYNMTWEQYCIWYGRPLNHPARSPAYAQVKRAEALAVGLGHIDKTPKTPKLRRPPEEGMPEAA